jgi:hypothetical protein
MTNHNCIAYKVIKLSNHWVYSWKPIRVYLFYRIPNLTGSEIILLSDFPPPAHGFTNESMLISESPGESVKTKISEAKK